MTLSLFLIFHLKNSLTFKMTEMTIFVTRVFGADIYFLYFSENVQVNPSGGNKWSNVRSFLSFSDLKRALSPSTEIGVLTFVVKKSTMELSRVPIFSA